MSEDNTTPAPEPAPAAPAQPTLPGTDTAAAAAEARAKAAEAKLAKKEEAERKAKSESDKRAKDVAAKKAVEDGKATEALEAANKALVAAEEKAAELEAAARTRIDAAIKRLPEEAQADIELVKDSLPLDKLGTFVDSKLAAMAGPPADSSSDTPPTDGQPATSPAPPTPGVRGTDNRSAAGYQIDPVTKEILEEMHAGPNTIELSKQLGKDGAGKFGWMRTDDENKNKGAFIHLLNSIAAVPHGGASEDAAYARVLKKK